MRFFPIAIIILFISIYIIYQNDNSDYLHIQEPVELSSFMVKTNSELITNHKIQLEIQNGCGVKGIAKLYTNFLRENGYDIIGYSNANEFNYDKTKLIIHKKDTSNFINEIINILKIDSKSIIYDYNYNFFEMTLIIGNDYKLLDSFNEVSKYYAPF